MVPTRTTFKLPSDSLPGDGGPARTPAGTMSTRRIRGGVIATFAIGAGVAAGLAAAAGSGPFAGLRPHITYAQVRSQVSQSPTSAEVLFPAPTPQVVNTVVTVVDPAPRAAVAAVRVPQHEDSHASTPSHDHAPPTTEPNDHAPSGHVPPSPPPGGDK